MSELEFLESPVLRTLGEVGLHFLWQGLALGVVTAIVLGWWPRDHRRRHAVLVGALAILMLLPGVTWLWLRGQPGFGSGTPVAVAESELEPELFAAVTMAPSVKVQSVLAFAWILGSVVLAIRWAGGIWWWRRLRSRSTRPATVVWQETVGQLARQMGIRRTVALRESRDVASPVVLGGWRPLILFPAGLLLQLSPDLVRALLIHELAHLRRRDHWVQALQQLAEVGLFFHPVVWWLSEQIRVEREQLCDDESAQWMGDRQVVAEALLCLAEGEAAGSVGALAASGSSLGQRIRRLLGHPLPEPWFNRARPVLGWLVSGLVGAGFTLLLCQNPESEPAEPPSRIGHNPQSHVAMLHQLETLEGRIVRSEALVDRLQTELQVPNVVVKLGPVFPANLERFLAELETRWLERQSRLVEEVRQGKALLEKTTGKSLSELETLWASADVPKLATLKVERDLARQRWSETKLQRGEDDAETLEQRRFVDSLDSQIAATIRNCRGKLRRQVDTEQTQLDSVSRDLTELGQFRSRDLEQLRPYMRARRELDTMRRMRNEIQIQVQQRSFSPPRTREL